MPYFSQYKQWVEFQVGGSKVGHYFERFSGGQVEYAVADASPANSGGHYYRATRFRIAELTIEGYLTRDSYNAIVAYLDQFHKDRSFSEQLSVRRTYRDGSGQAVTEVYEDCVVISPAQPEDGDVTRDTDFLMFSVRIQPHKKKLYIDGTLIQSWDPADQLNDQSAYVNP